MVQSRLRFQRQRGFVTIVRWVELLRNPSRRLQWRMGFAVAQPILQGPAFAATNGKSGRNRMHRILIAIAASIVSLMPASAAEQDIVLRGMGSFHVGGRVVEISGKPVREIVRQPGGPLTRLDPNGQYMVEQMYVQYFLPKERKGKLPLLMWHGGGRSGGSSQ